MSLLTPTLLATARAAAVALLAVLAALAACGFLRGLSTRALRTVFATTAVVFFTPTMLAGYGWLAQASLGWIELISWLTLNLSFLLSFL